MYQDGLGLTHPAGSVGRAFGQRADLGADDRDVSRAQAVKIGSGLVVREHVIVHRGGEQNWSGGGDEERSQEVVRDTPGHPSDQVGGGWSDHDQIGFPSQLDMRERRAAFPNGGVDRASREGFKGEGPHELRGGVREHRIHQRATLDEAAREDTALITCDPARHAEDDASAGPGGHASERRRRTSL